MPEITLDQVAAAVAELRAANENAARSLSLPDPEDASRPYSVAPPAGPADPARIAEVETALGRKLPPSFRHFLSLHDGWKEADMGSDLLGTQALIEFNTLYAERALRPILDEIERDTPDDLVVFGKFPSDNSMFIFDASEPDEDGEWTVIEYDAKEGMLDEYDNFLEFLKDTADTVRMMGG